MLRRTMTVLWFGLWGVLSAGCGGTQATTATEPGESAAASQGTEPDRGHHMLQTFWMAVDAREAVIDGDLEAAKDAARKLVAHDYGNAFPEDWRHWVAQLKQHADSVILAGNLEQAAVAVGALALTCGNCHWQQRARPGGVRTEPEPWREPPDDLGDRMTRHQIGAQDLWAGLVVPSEDAWRSGTITLTRAPLAAPTQDGEPVDPDTAARVARIRDIGARARTASTHVERGRIYGELIATCAGCHSQVRRQAR